MQKYNTKPKEFTEMPKILSHLLSNIFFFQEQSYRKLVLKKGGGIRIVTCPYVFSLSLTRASSE